jgi:hypothetical protein
MTKNTATAHHSNEKILTLKAWLSSILLSMISPIEKVLTYNLSVNIFVYLFNENVILHTSQFRFRKTFAIE